MFNTISDFFVGNVVFINSTPDVHHQQRREKKHVMIKIEVRSGVQNLNEEWDVYFHS